MGILHNGVDRMADCFDDGFLIIDIDGWGSYLQCRSGRVNASMGEILCEEILVILYELCVGCAERREEGSPCLVDDSHVF